MAAIFEEKFIAKKMDNTFWEVREAIAITTYFSGLCLIECMMDLKLKQLTRGPDGYTITHTWPRNAVLRWPLSTWYHRQGGFATQLVKYINRVNSQLEKF
jgi:hypothetical protein